MGAIHLCIGIDAKSARNITAVVEPSPRRDALGTPPPSSPSQETGMLCVNSQQLPCTTAATDELPASQLFPGLLARRRFEAQRTRETESGQELASTRCADRMWTQKGIYCNSLKLGSYNYLCLFAHNFPFRVEVSSSCKTVENCNKSHLGCKKTQDLPFVISPGTEILKFRHALLHSLLVANRE